MSLYLVLIASAGAATATPPPAPDASTRWQRFAAAARAMNVPTTHLYDAFASVRHDTRSRALRYCFKDALTDSDAPRAVCRTRSYWQAYGIDPIDG